MASLNWRGFIDELLSLMFPKFSPLVQDAKKEDIRNAINTKRARYGLGPLKLNLELSQIAQQHVTTLSSNGQYLADFNCRLIHIFPKLPDLPRGHPTVTEIVRSWMNSQPHRANLLGHYTLLGVGRAKSLSGELYWVIDFDA